MPNAFVADPPLEQATARTLEGGVRGRLPVARIAWNASIFRMVNRDDILFIRGGGVLTNEGHFENIGSTEPARSRARAAGNLGRMRWTTSYTIFRRCSNAGHTQQSESSRRS